MPASRCSIVEPGVQRRLHMLKSKSQGFCVERIIVDVQLAGGDPVQPVRFVS